MVSVDFAVGPSYEVVIVGDSRARDTKEMVRAVNGEFIPNKVVIFVPMEHDSSEIKGIAPFTALQTGIDHKATTYICVNHNCKFPTMDIDAMLSLPNPS